MNTENNIDPLNNTDPSQTSIFEDATYLEIDHPSTEDEAVMEENEKTGTSKFKILAALAIVAMAGYISYWVQSPIQLKTDVLGSNTVAQANIEKDVTITLYGFTPANLNINKGTIVKWTNTSSEDQSLIGSTPDGDGFTSPVLSTGQTFSFTFDKDATFKYYSTYNPALKATITVGTGTVSNVGKNTQPATTTTASTTTTPATPTTTPTTTSTITTPATVPAVTTPTPDLSPDLSGTKTTVANVALTTPIINSPSQSNIIAENALNTQNATDQNATTQKVNLHGTAYKGKLAKTGPEDGLYILIFGFILYFNRKKLFSAFQK